MNQGQITQPDKKTTVTNSNISEFLQTKINEGNFPSASYLIAEKGDIKFQDAIGYAVRKPEMIPAEITTIYDAASLTKPLIIGLIFGKLIEKGEIHLHNPISKFFPDFNPEITIEHLLTHTSGLRSWMPFYFLAESRAAIPPIIARESKNAIPNEKIEYSDLNFIMLAFLIEEIYGEGLEKVAARKIFEPLKLPRTFFNPAPELKREIAATEFGNEYELQLAKEKGFEIKPGVLRNYQIWGEVHDGNCYFMNGVSGHAGLFSTAKGIFKIAQHFLPDQTTLLKPETCHLFQTNFTKMLPESRSIAFELALNERTTAGSRMQKDSFGHLGFAGTSLWIEPHTERIFILLTNRVHDHPLPFANINQIRRSFHDLAIEELSLYIEK